MPGSVFNIQSSTNGTSWGDRTPADTGGNLIYNSIAVDDANRILVLQDDGDFQVSANGTAWVTAGSLNGITMPVPNGLCHSAGVVSSR